MPCTLIIANKRALSRLVEHIVECKCTECAQEFVDCLEIVHKEMTLVLQSIDLQRSELQADEKRRILSLREAFKSGVHCTVSQHAKRPWYMKDGLFANHNADQDEEQP